MSTKKAIREDIRETMCRLDGMWAEAVLRRIVRDALAAAARLDYLEDELLRLASEDEDASE